MTMLMRHAALGSPAPQIYVDDVFVSYTREGTGASQVTTTNIDMTQGYTLWTKGRSGATDHSIYHSARGVTKDLVTNTTAAETTEAQGLTAVSSTSHTYGTLAKVNTSAATYVDWVLRNAPKFYHHTTLVKTGGSNATYDFSTLGTLGMVRVKRTDAAGSWYIWHRSLTAGKLLIGETTAAEATLGQITVSGTTVTLVNGVIADGTYLVEAWAHDTSAEGLIQCGSFSVSGAAQDITLGWEAQFLMTIPAAVGGYGTFMFDTMRGMPVGGDAWVKANSANAEVSNTFVCPTATGFRDEGGLPVDSKTVYLAIRRPNKPPTIGTQVYNAIARTGTGAAATVTGVGFAPDLLMTVLRTSPQGCATIVDRLRGPTPVLLSSSTAAENTTYATTEVQSFEMDGFKVGTSAAANWFNGSGSSLINWFFRRAPGFMDEVCFAGDGSSNRAVPHNLGVTPEMYFNKGRSGDTVLGWAVYHKDIGVTKVLELNSTVAAATDNWFGTVAPDADYFRVSGNDPHANRSAPAVIYVTYLFATLAGISKVGSYTGNGSSLTVNCGFSGGARFILIKRTDAAGNWKVIDSTRGIVAGNDPTLALNSTAAEVTGTDCIDPDSSGFIVVQEATNNLNVNGGVYVFLAIS